MTPESILSVIRDILVLAYMFVLRIGVPILITLMIGAWLRKLLEDKAEKPAYVPASGHQHCWDTNQTSETDELKRIAARRPDLPCWLAIQVAGPGLKETCYSCPVYKLHGAASIRA